MYLVVETNYTKCIKSPKSSSGKRVINAIGVFDQYMNELSHSEHKDLYVLKFVFKELRNGKASEIF